MSTTATVAPTEASENQTKAKVQIRLSTRHEDIAISDDPGALLVSTNFKRLALSTLVNNLLHTSKPIPFEFLINGLALRTSIEEFLSSNGISAETVLNVEYFRALVPPQHKTSFQHDDWVSAVDILPSRTAEDGTSGATRILSGSYDGLLRVWTPSSDLLATSPLPPNNNRVQSIKSAAFISPTRLVSGGTDMTVRVWKYHEADETNAKISLHLELYGHKWGITHLATSHATSRILSASADHSVGFWSTRASDAPSAPESLFPRTSTKRQKLASKSTDDTPKSSDVPRRGPLALLQGHTAPVRAVIFSPTDSSVAYSASQDHTLRTWDLETSTLVTTRAFSSSLSSILSLPTLGLLATGSSARHITLTDPRASTLATMTMRGHTNNVVSLAASPTSPYVFVSGSHDGTARIWDVRQVRPGGGASDIGGDSGGQIGEAISVLERESLRGRKRPVGGEGVKVFGVAWDKDVGIVSGGEDKVVQIDGWDAGAA